MKAILTLATCLVCQHTTKKMMKVWKLRKIWDRSSQLEFWKLKLCGAEMRQIWQVHSKWSTKFPIWVGLRWNLRNQASLLGLERKAQLHLSLAVKPNFRQDSKSLNRKISRISSHIQFQVNFLQVKEKDRQKSKYQPREAACSKPLINDQINILKQT